jgi:hypothetical protein
MPSNDERLLGKMEAGIATVADNQTTIMTEFREHRKDMAHAHAETSLRISEVEADAERIEAKVEGHADEDDKRFALLWRIGGAVAGILGAGIIIAAKASGYL